MPWHYVPDVDAFTIYHRVREENVANGPSDSTLGSALGHALAGSCGTAVSNVILYPLDLVITRLQARHRQPLSSSPTRGKDGAHGTVSKNTAPGSVEHEALEDDQQDDAVVQPTVFSTIRALYITGGIQAFYAGLGPDTLKSIIDSFLFFLFYNLLWHLNHRHLSTSSTTTSKAALGTTTRKIGTEITMGVLAGASTKALTSPIQQVVTRMQTQNTGQYASGKEFGKRKGKNPPTTCTIINDIYTQRGVRGFWAGYTASLILTLNPSLTFLIDSLLRRLISRRQRLNKTSSNNASSTRSLPPSTTFLVAALGKATASSIMYPISLAKTQAQLDGRGANVAAAVRGIVQDEGVGALYTGLGGEVLKGFLGHGLTMLVKERVVRGVLGLWALLWRWVVWLRERRGRTM